MLAAGLTACTTNWGVRPEQFAPAVGPAGAQVTVRIRGDSTDRMGELIAVDSSGVTIKIGRLVTVPWSRLEAMDVSQMGRDYDVSSGEVVKPEKRRRLALISRFPQGLARVPISIDSLSGDAMQKSAQYENRRVAIDAGYRRIGADFPSMGEHWLNVDELMAGRVDPAKPTLLVYADLKGQPTLLGVGFAFITHGDSQPVHLPGWPQAWHEHSGLLAEESGAHVGHGGSKTQTHLWVMHAWTALENPDGRFAAENWLVPYARAGRTAPHHPDVAAARALSLTVGGDQFLVGLLSDAGLRTTTSSARIDSLISTSRARAISAHDDTELRAVWSELESNLVRIAGPAVRALFQAPHAATDAHR
jgi:hypothetical protein